MAKNRDTGCGCYFAVIIIIAIISGIKSCTMHLIKGDYDLPSFRQTSGNSGTSNSNYDKHKISASPVNIHNNSFKNNTNTSTNKIQKELQEYRSTQNQNSNSIIRNSCSSNMNHTSSAPTTDYQSIINRIPAPQNVQEPKTYNKTCSRCQGTGTIEHNYFYEAIKGISCGTCGRTDSHSHKEYVKCDFCHGLGKVKIKIINGAEILDHKY